jgi:hypothetical protein
MTTSLLKTNRNLRSVNKNLNAKDNIEGQVLSDRSIDK